MKYRFSVCVCVAVGASSLAVTPAHATDTREKELCIAAADEGQVQRDKNQYRTARDAFSRCALATCPDVLRQDCARWLVDVDAKTPTVILSARSDKDEDVTDVVVTMDEAPFATALDGHAAPVDPGEHVFRFEAHGFSPVERHAIFLPGDKDRAVAVRLERAPAKDAWTLPTAAPATSEHATPAARRPPLAAWVLSGVAVAAFGSQAYFGVSALSQRSGDLGANGCAPRCSPTEASNVHTQFVIADVSFGVGVAAAALAAYFFLAPRGRPAHGPVGIVSSDAAGGAARLGIRF